MPDDNWYLVDNGATLGQRGSENGVIIRDEEHSRGARITLEQGSNIALFSITCGIYGVMFHTRFFANEAEGRAAYNLMKPEIALIAEGDASTAPVMASAFVAQFP